MHIYTPCYLKPSIHSVSACKPRPSAASAAALYPRRAWSLDMAPLSRSARKPANSVGEAAHVDADERALLCPGQLFLAALHAADSPARRGAGSYVKRQRRQAGVAGRQREAAGRSVIAVTA